MPQIMIQGFIERISLHIQEVIRLKGGNEYKEDKGKRVVEINRVVNSDLWEDLDEDLNEDAI